MSKRRLLRHVFVSMIAVLTGGCVAAEEEDAVGFTHDAVRPCGGNGKNAVPCETNPTPEPEPPPASEPESNPTPSPSWIYDETFDEATVWPHWTYLKTHYIQIQNCRISNVSPCLGSTNPSSVDPFLVTDMRSVYGPNSGRFELRHSDAMASGGTRSEINFPPYDVEGGVAETRWLSFSFFPQNYDPDDAGSDSNLRQSISNANSLSELIVQWHDGQGSPPLSLQIVGGRYRIRIHKTVESLKQGEQVHRYLDLGPVVSNAWTQIVLKAKLTTSRTTNTTSQGELSAWVDGVAKGTLHGRNIKETSYVRPKIGIYKSSWNDSKPSATDATQGKRIIFFDNVRWGGPNAQPADMMK
jgi:hypothetical protein